MQTQHSPVAGRGHVARVVVGLTAALTVLLVAFAWPTSELEPRNLPIAVAGPVDAVAEVSEMVGTAAGEEAFEISAVGSRDESVTLIEEREVYGAIVLSARGPELLVASAASPVVAQMLTQVGTQLAAGSNTPPKVTDVAPLPEADPRGAVFGAGSLPLVIGGIATAAMLSLRVASRPRRVAGATGVAVGAGLALAAVLQPWFGALEGSYLANAGVLAMAIGAMALVISGLYNVLGPLGLGIGAATMLLLGNPLSGITSAPELLPEGWSTLGQLLPPGAAGTALRSTAFFDGAGAATPLLVLAGWIVVGLVLALAPAGRRETDTAEWRAASTPERTAPSTGTALSR